MTVQELIDRLKNENTEYLIVINGELKFEIETDRYFGMVDIKT